jgi:hypothetical protein
MSKARLNVNTKVRYVTGIIFSYTERLPDFGIIKGKQIGQHVLVEWHYSDCVSRPYSCHVSNLVKYNK